jgi:hypothetical protein
MFDLRRVVEWELQRLGKLNYETPFSVLSSTGISLLAIVLHYKGEGN